MFPVTQKLKQRDIEVCTLPLRAERARERDRFCVRALLTSAKVAQARRARGWTHAARQRAIEDGRNRAETSATAAAEAGQDAIHVRGGGGGD